MAREFYFRIPATLSLRVRAKDEATALAAAEAWQMHANGWPEFTTDYEPAEQMDPAALPRGARIIDATVYVDSDGNPTLRTTDDDEDDETDPE